MINEFISVTNVARFLAFHRIPVGRQRLHYFCPKNLPVLDFGQSSFVGLASLVNFAHRLVTLLICYVGRVEPARAACGGRPSSIANIIWVHHFIGL